MLHCVYLIENQINKKAYVGYSSNYIKRWEDEAKELNKGILFNNVIGHPLIRAWNKYGKHNFQFKIYSFYDTEELALKVEARVESCYRALRMQYNIVPGGGKPPSSKDRIVSLETRDKLRLSTVKTQFKKGYKMTPENIKKRSESQKKNYVINGIPDSCFKKGSLPWNLGKDCSKELKKQISETLKHKWDNDEEYRNLMLNKPPHSEETKNRISESKNATKYLAFGEEKTIRNWIKDYRCKATKSCIYTRLKASWSIEKAITTPSNRKNN